MDLLENEVELVTELCKRLNAEREKRRPEATMKLLDLGCGTGKLAIYLQKELGCEVIGVDPVQTNVEKARLKSSAVMFKVQSAEELSFEDSAFDFAVSLKALHEIPDPKKALRESHRMLKAGGKMFIIDWIGGVPQTSSHGHAKQYFSPQRLKEALSEAGFADCSIKPNKEGTLMLGEGRKNTRRD
ncbi:MAG: class I SAM-dependent methyltransferase [Methanomicrobia archaeon]|nr:class I SAM-dependent methyltransferase [Methanomicrobia archaeon]